MSRVRRHLSSGTPKDVLPHEEKQLGQISRRLYTRLIRTAPRPSPVLICQASSIFREIAAASTTATSERYSPNFFIPFHCSVENVSRVVLRRGIRHSAGPCKSGSWNYLGETQPCLCADTRAHADQTVFNAVDTASTSQPIQPTQESELLYQPSIPAHQLGGHLPASRFPVLTQPPSCNSYADGASPVSYTRRAAALAFSASAATIFTPKPAIATAAGVADNSSSSGSIFLSQVTPTMGRQQANAEEGGSGDTVPARPQRRIWPSVPQVQLAPGLRISKVIRGCWQLSGRHKGDPITDRTSGSAVLTDLAAFHRAGITTLDVADNYGPAETMVGQYLRMYPDNAATTTISTKLSYLTEEDMQTVNRTMVEYAVRSSLVRIGRERLDLVQLQWAEPVRHRRWLDVLKWLAELREEGLIGHLGVCNFAVPQLAAAMDAGVGLVSNQVQYSLIDRRPQLLMEKAAASYGIKLLAYGTVAGGLLADKFHDAPANKVRLDTASKQKYGMILRQAGGSSSSGSAGGGGGWSWMQEVLQATRTVAQRHGVSSSVVATAWVLQQPQVAAAIVGARNTRHVRDMQAACALKLNDVDMLDLDAVWEGVPEPPTSDVYVWERGGAW